MSFRGRVADDRNRGFAPRGGGFAPPSPGFAATFGPESSGVAPLGVDGTSTVFWPKAKEHWATMSLPIPASYFQLQETASPVVDDVHGDTMVATGAPTFNASGSDPLFVSKGVRFTEGTNAQGLSAVAGALHDPLYQHIFVYLLLEPTTLPTAGQSRAIWAGTGAASWYMGAFLSTTNFRLQCRGPAATSGVQNYPLNTTFGIVLQWKPGTGVLGNSSAGIWRASTEKELITSTKGVVSDATKGPATGGSASLNSAGFILRRKAVWVGSEADTIAALASNGPKALLQALGHVVTY